jgi:hypothetical protein
MLQCRSLLQFASYLPRSECLGILAASIMQIAETASAVSRGLSELTSGQDCLEDRKRIAV